MKYATGVEPGSLKRLAPTGWPGVPIRANILEPPLPFTLCNAIFWFLRYCGPCPAFPSERGDNGTVKKINDDATQRSEKHEKYDPGNANCAEFAEDELKLGGLVTDSTQATPNGMFNEIGPSAIYRYSSECDGELDS